MTQEQWIKAYNDKNALWIHDGNPTRCHAELTSGNHSNGFFNSRLVIPDDFLMSTAAYELINQFPMAQVWEIDRVVGPQTGATKLAEFLAMEIGKRRGRPCKWASPAKVGEGADKKLVFEESNGVVLPGENVLLCDDVWTTGGSIALAKELSEDAGGIVQPCFLVLVNRSEYKPSDDDSFNVISLIRHPMPIWKPDDCELCEMGSTAIPAKDPANWARLNAKL